MPTFTRCGKEEESFAGEILRKHESHHPLVACKVKIDLVFAHADVDEDGNAVNDALTKNGVKALGVTRKLSLKDRVMGRGDAEVCIDADWWAKATAEQQEALLDHEIHHIAVKADKHGNAQYDDLGRPQLKLRKHDIEVGWFKCVAERNGAASLERIQARRIMDHYGQFFFPEFCQTVEISTEGFTTGPLPLGTFAKASAKLA